MWRYVQSAKKRWLHVTSKVDILFFARSMFFGVIQIFRGDILYNYTARTVVQYCINLTGSQSRYKLSLCNTFYKPYESHGRTQCSALPKRSLSDRHGH